MKHYLQQLLMNSPEAKTDKLHCSDDSAQPEYPAFCESDLCLSGDVTAVSQYKTGELYPSRFRENEEPSMAPPGTLILDVLPEIRQKLSTMNRKGP